MTSSKKHQIDIVATIGPASDDPSTLVELLEAGVTIARLNTKHGTTAWHQDRVRRIRAAAKEVGREVPILLDLQGPEIRLNLPDKKPFEVGKSENVHFVSEFQTDLHNQIQIPQNVINSLEIGHKVTLEDGLCEFEISKKFAQTATAKALRACTVRDRKTMNTPGLVIDMPSLIPSDLEKLDFLGEDPVDIIALSFVRDANDLHILRNELERRKVTAKICAKIENQAAIDHLEEIIEHADLVMVARGDLGVEIPMEELSFRQKQIIYLSRQKNKFVITATQMMKSMENNPRPTRAEVCDVANAVFDGTDATMLSEETAMGEYPVETVKIMRQLVDFNLPLIDKVKSHNYSLK